MHLVIGAVASALLAGRRQPGPDRPPSFWGTLEVAHAIPGRVRFHCPSLKETDVEVPADAPVARLESDLPRLPGVSTVRANPVSGSIVVVYDPSRIDAHTVQVGVLKLLGLEAAADHPAPAALTRETREILDSLNNAVLDVSRGAMDMDFLVPTLLMTLAVLPGKARLGAPAAFTLFWWAFSYMTRERTR